MLKICILNISGIIYNMGNRDRYWFGWELNFDVMIF